MHMPCSGFTSSHRANRSRRSDRLIGHVRSLRSVIRCLSLLFCPPVSARRRCHSLSFLLGQIALAADSLLQRVQAVAGVTGPSSRPSGRRRAALRLYATLPTAPPTLRRRLYPFPKTALPTRPLHPVVLCTSAARSVNSNTDRRENFAGMSQLFLTNKKQKKISVACNRNLPGSRPFPS